MTYDTQYNSREIEYIDHNYLSGVYTTNLLNHLEFYLDQILSLYEARSLGKYLTKIFNFIKGQYLAQIKIQIVIQIGYVDAALSDDSSL